MIDTTDPALADGGDQPAVAAPPVQSTAPDASSFPTSPPTVQEPQTFGEMIRARIMSRLTGITPEMQQRSAETEFYKQQQALQYFTARSDEDHKNSLEWADRALKQQDVLDQARNVLLRMDPSTAQYQAQQQIVAEKQRYFDSLTQAAQGYNQSAQHFSDQIPAMIAAMRGQPPPQAGAKTSRGNFPVNPPSDQTYSIPSYAGMKESGTPPDVAAAEQAKLQAPGAAPQEAPPHPAFWTPENWSQVASDYGIRGIPSQDGKTLVYTVTSDGEEQQIQKKIQAMRDTFGVEPPIVVDNIYGTLRDASQKYEDWSKIALQAKAKASSYENLMNATKDEASLNEMLVMATNGPTADPELAANLRMILGATRDKRVDVVRGIVSKYNSDAEQAQDEADVFKGGNDAFAKLSAPYGTAPAGSNDAAYEAASQQAAQAAGTASDQERAFANAYAAQRKWSKIGPAQKQEFQGVLKRWRLAHGAAGS